MKNHEHGFTIVELMFSTMVFSTILLLSMSALIQIGRMYYKGVTTSQTQQTARALLDEISQGIQFSGSGIQPPSLVAGPVVAVTGSDIKTNAVGYFCIGTTRYSFAIDRMHDGSITKSASGSTANLGRKAIRHAMWADSPAQCFRATGLAPADLTDDTLTAGRDLLADNMRLSRLAIEPAPGINDGSTWVVKLTVLYGDDDLMEVDSLSGRRTCKTAQAGTQFCAVSELSTIVKRRVQ